MNTSNTWGNNTWETAVRAAFTTLRACVVLWACAAPALAEEVILGLGYDRSRDGHGFELHKAGDVWALYFYTYDRRGDPEWYLGTAEMRAGVLRGGLDRYTYDVNGTPAATPDPAFSGEFTLDFTRGLDAPACDDGVNRIDAKQVSEFTWRIGEESGSWCTELLEFGPSPGRDPYYGGIWYGGPEDSGYGFTMAHMGDTVTALAYYYDEEGNPRWALGAAPADGLGIELNHYLGYCRLCPPLSVDASPAGSLSLDRDRSRPPDSGHDRALLDLVYPEPPYGEFLREFSLYRLSDGEPIGEYVAGVNIDASTRYVAAWEDTPDGEAWPDVGASTAPGSPFTERTVNTTFPGEQIEPAVAVAPDGAHVVVWTDDADGNGAYQVHARGFNPDGTERFGVITVNVEGAGQQVRPDVAMADNGEFVVVWEDDFDNNFFGEILARGFHANGSERFAPITVNEEGAGHQLQPVIGMDQDGGFVVAWTDDQDANGFHDIMARRFRHTGAARAGQFRVNVDGGHDEHAPAVSMAADGSFAVAWQTDLDADQHPEVYVRPFDAGGTALAGDLSADPTRVGSQVQPAVAIASDGSGFAIAWIGRGEQVHVRGYQRDGTARFNPVAASNEPLHFHARPSVGIDRDGGIVVAWEALVSNEGFRVLGTVIGPGGQAGAGFLVSTATDGAQRAPVIAIR